MITPGIKAFVRYACVGAANTCIHWSLFLGLVYLAGRGQASANVLAFLAAVTFSYFVNARWTFRTAVSWRRYLYFTCFMAGMAAASGWVAQRLMWPPLLTLCLFSAASLVLGYRYAHGVVFKQGPR
ncbi:GtrA family protein [Pseudomonas typographi]|uniref:Bactoprenol-linked glucose translocase n=1 Tax=Pseudomonas typographi TaxID=2715964 RepID=A0ABR7YXS0_9PSED|nr:GtrA family protein [Pseudomonas typographi]MBD1554986.1 GtrA family protein [Pseudomonas typographi]MBD1588018.1 GtrA family protein [Pseudomonas typographi]MBD1598006.1 GtrA family protein [Pseudomonas typographi]